MSKNILVTGVSRGLGLEIVRGLLAGGWSVFGVSRTHSPALAALEEEHPTRFRFSAIDLADPGRAAGEISNAFGGLDVPLHGYVNNAAEAYDDIVTNLRLEPLEHMFAVNVLTPMLITRHVLRNMLLHGTAGSIVHISSISVHTGYKGLAMYAATKGALEAFSKNVAREWGGRKIRSNCVVAGFTETAMTAGLSPEQKERIRRRTALGEPTRAASIAAAVVFLLGETAASVTGQDITVDAGTI